MRSSIFHSEMAGARVRDDRTRIIVSPETLKNEFIKAEWLRSPHLDKSIYRSANRDPRNRCGDVVSRHRLYEHVRFS